MNVESSTLEANTRKYHIGIICLYGSCLLTFLLALFEFFLRPAFAVDGSPLAVAFRAYWPIFVLYLMGLVCALFYAPTALKNAQSVGKNTAKFSIGCVLASLGGFAMSLSIGDDGIGRGVIHFYWGGLALIWVASVAMAYLSETLAKPLAVRDWVVYSFSMLVIPLTLVPSISLWPLFFELDSHETILTATTSSFAAHFLVAHYVIFEILDRRKTKSPVG